ncbi:MAG: formate dehydrogenase subunit gamma, partial [Acidovorax sp.]
VSEGWAKEHHALWHDDVQAGKIPRQRSASQPAAAAATTPSAGLPAQG